MCSFSSDSKVECESFISWLNCKFTRFFVAVNISKTTVKIKAPILDRSHTNYAENIEKPKVAIKQEEKSSFVISEKSSIVYRLEDYSEAVIAVTPMNTTDYVLKENMALITSKLQKIVDVEAPITHDRLLKKCLRAFGISRSSAATLEATEKALKKVDAKANKQNGIKFYWSNNQNADVYEFYRNDAGNSDHRLPDEITQQELKNAVCLTIENGESFDKDALIKATIHTMGYARSGKALVEAVERGIKYGFKTGELIRNEDKTIGRVQKY